MIASRRLQRANTIPEMALVLSLVMLTLFGIVQYALVGFNQIGSDGAAFVGDHSAVAQYGAPTSTNSVYAQQVGLVSFPHANTVFSAQIPRNMTYETDVLATRKAIGFGQLFPTTTQTYSRIIEPSQSVQAAKPDCASGPETITVAGTTILSKATAPLFGGLSTDKLYQTVQTSGGTALDLNLAALNGPGSTTTVETTIANQFAATVNQLQVVSSALNTVSTISPTIGQKLEQGISSDITPLIASATGGTYVATGSNGAQITTTIPLTNAQFSAQVGVDTNLITSLEASQGLSGAVSTLISGVLNPALFGTTVPPTPGLLGTGGPVQLLNSAQGALSAIDAASGSC